MLELISRRDWSACDLAKQFRHSQPTISNHLRVLHGAGLVQFERQGRNLVYASTPGGLASVKDWLAKFPADTLATPR